MRNKTIWILLGTLVVIAFFLRVMYLPQNALSFYYDTARDAFTIRNILAGDIKVQGPPVSIGGIFHGVAYYYFLLPAYFVGAGNPIVAAYYQAFFSSLSIICVYFLTRTIFDDTKVALLSAGITAVSWEAAQYALWLSNPTLAFISLPALYLMLALWYKDSKWYFAALAGVGLGFTVQANVAYVYHGLVAGLFFLLALKRLKLKNILVFTSSFLISISTMLVTQLKFGNSQSVIHLVTRQDAFVKGENIISILRLYIAQVSDVTVHNISPFLPSNIGAILFVALVVGTIIHVIKKKKEIPLMLLLPFYALAHLPASFFGGRSTPHIAAGIGIAVIILFSYWVVKLWRVNSILALVIIGSVVVSGVIADISRNKYGQTLLTIQKEMTLANQLKLVDYTYQHSDGHAFSVNSLTNPLWINTTWSYLYNWHGQSKYGYLPFWHGRDQIGLLGNNLAFPVKDVSNYYFIVEPTQGIPDYLVINELSSEEAKYIKVDETYFGPEMKIFSEIKR